MNIDRTQLEKFKTIGLVILLLFLTVLPFSIRHSARITPSSDFALTRGRWRAILSEEREKGRPLYMTSDLGVSVYDAIPIVISNRTKFQFRFCRIGCDLICVIIGTVCGLMPGLGTIITAFFMGPLIEFFNNTFSRPLLYGRKK